MSLSDGLLTPEHEPGDGAAGLDSLDCELSTRASEASASSSGWGPRRGAGGPGLPSASVQLFVLVHGICGAESNWSVWKERMALAGRDDWDVRAASSITPGSFFAGQDVRRLGRLLADEVTGWVHGHLDSGTSVALHFVCHSLGGLVVRAALPQVCDSLEGEPLVSYGHVLTLNTPHLGVRAGSLLMCWKNWSPMIPRVFFQQVHEVALCDGAATPGSKPGGARPRLLEELANPRGKSSCCLSRFRHVTAVAATHWDVIVPFCTAAVCAKNPFPSPSILTGDVRGFWRIDAATGFEEGSVFAERQAKGGAAAALAASLAAGESAPAAGKPPGRRWTASWITSSDKEVSFPLEMLEGLTSAVRWRRVAYTLHQPWWGGGDVHLFSIGKDRKVLNWSHEFIDMFVAMFQAET